MRRSLRRMNREMGKMISSVKEDDKSFQVPKVTVFFKLILLFYGFFPSGDG
jgi:tRNA U54 and U55 pseudouridine synthase Pus10